jgi:hypothetical protein
MNVLLNILCWLTPLGIAGGLDGSPASPQAARANLVLAASSPDAQPTCRSVDSLPAGDAFFAELGATSGEEDDPTGEDSLGLDLISRPDFDLRDRWSTHLRPAPGRLIGCSPSRTLPLRF